MTPDSTDALHPIIAYHWAWKTRTWIAVAGGTVIIAEATSSTAIIAQAWAWARSWLD